MTRALVLVPVLAPGRVWLHVMQAQRVVQCHATRRVRVSTWQRVFSLPVPAQRLTFTCPHDARLPL